MPTFSVTAQNLAWVSTAPVVLKNIVAINATPGDVF